MSGGAKKTLEEVRSDIINVVVYFRPEGERPRYIEFRPGEVVVLTADEAGLVREHLEGIEPVPCDYGCSELLTPAA